MNFKQTTFASPSYDFLSVLFERNVWSITFTSPYYGFLVWLAIKYPEIIECTNDESEQNQPNMDTDKQSVDSILSR